MTRFIAVLAALLLFSACGPGPAPTPKSTFWDTPGDVLGLDARIDSNFLHRGLDEAVAASEAVAIVRFTGIEQIMYPGPLTVDVQVEDPADQWQVDRIQELRATEPSATTYRAEIDRWIIGSGGSEILITSSGGMRNDGSLSFIDGFFLPEEGRTYLVVLYKDTEDRYRCCWARQNFDLTEGVKVLNHPFTRDLEGLEGMPVDSFVAYMKDLAERPGS